MTHHFEQRTLPFAPEVLFDLVADIERYPEFLPWCRSISIRQRQENWIESEMEVGIGRLRESFASIATFERPRRISIRYGGGALKNLASEWLFAPDKLGCRLTFEVDFTIRSPLLGGVMGLFFDQAVRKMVSAFENRAASLTSGTI
jgi:coenzyme Q-binding protein COQ10